MKSNIHTITALHTTCLTIRSVRRTDSISPDILVRVEADSNYSRLFLADGSTVFVARGLKRFQEVLDSTVFIRAHNTHLININFIAGMNSTGDIHLQNGDCIPVARRRKNMVISCLRSMVKKVC